MNKPFNFDRIPPDPRQQIVNNARATRDADIKSYGPAIAVVGDTMKAIGDNHAAAVRAGRNESLRLMEESLNRDYPDRVKNKTRMQDTVAWKFLKRYQSEDSADEEAQKREAMQLGDFFAGVFGDDEAGLAEAEKDGGLLGQEWLQVLAGTFVGAQSQERKYEIIEKTKAEIRARRGQPARTDTALLPVSPQSSAGTGGALTGGVGPTTPQPTPSNNKGGA